MVEAMAGYIRKHAPALAEADVPMAAMIVFTSKGLKDLDLAGSSYPAMHASKVKGYLRQKGLGPPMPSEAYEALRQAFDQAAGGLAPAAEAVAYDRTA
jgi:hypothetical protein